MRLGFHWMPLVGVFFANACASSPLPVPGDATWQGGQERLRTGLVVVEPEAALTPDVVVMVQAESFFHSHIPEHPTACFKTRSASP